MGSIEDFDVVNLQIISTQPPVLKPPIILSSHVHCRDRWTSQGILPLRCFSETTESGNVMRVLS